MLTHASSVIAAKAARYFMADSAMPVSHPLPAAHPQVSATQLRSSVLGTSGAPCPNSLPFAQGGWGEKRAGWKHFPTFA